MDTLWDILNDRLKSIESGFDIAISELKKQIALLKHKQAALTALRKMKVGDIPPSTRKNKGRTDWAAVLKQLPREFTAQDAVQVSGRPLDAVYSRLSVLTAHGKLKKTGKTYAKTDARQ